jgi:cytoskeletal protein RodZ
MRSSFVPLLAIALLCLGLTACGEASKGASSESRTSSNAALGASTSTTSSPTSAASSTTLTASHPKDSNDGDDDPNSSDDNEILDYGRAASAVDKRKITAVVTSYYAAAAADDGAKACTLLYSLIAESLPEEYSQTSGAKTCSTVMSELFKQHQQQMTADNATLKETRVRDEGSKGLALVSFGKMPEPHVRLHSEGAAWKMESLFETGMP